MGKITSLLGSARVTLFSAQDYRKEALNHEKHGNLDKAEASYRQAIDAGQKAHQMDSAKSQENPQVSRMLAKINLDYGRLLERLGRSVEAEVIYKKAQEYAQKAYALEPNQPKAQALLKNIEFGYSQFLKTQGQGIQADQALEKAVHVIQSSPASNRSGITDYFSSSSDWVPSGQEPTHGSPSYLVNNPAFQTHLSGLSACASPFFTQILRFDAVSFDYALPQPGELIQDTHYLAWCLQHDQAKPEDKKAWINTAKEVIEQFKRLKIKELAHIQELVIFAAVDHPELHRTITNAFLEGLKPERDSLINLPLLRGLSVMVLHRSHLTRDIHSAGDCITLLQALLKILERIHPDNNQEQVQTLLQTISLLLDQMVYFRVKELDRIGIQEPVKRALDRFVNDPKKYPELAWPIKYIQQALARLPNNERFSEALIRRALPALKGLSYLSTFGLKIASAEGFISGFEPDKLWETYSGFKEVFSEVESFKRFPWYGELCFIDILIDMGRLDLLGQLLERGSAKRDEAYLRGLCDRFERIACVQGDLEARDSALRLLKGFKEGQIKWAQYESIQHYASQSLNHLALMWPTPDIMAMEREGYAPPAWHPFWAERSESLLLKKIQGKAQRHANLQAMQSQLTSIASHNEQIQRLVQLPISLADLRSALYQYYQLSNLSVQRVSGDKMSLADCYINLAIVESQVQREKDKEELEKQATTFERLSSSEQLEVANPNKLIALEKLFDAQELRDGLEGVPKRILIQGRAGIGKTTLCKKLVHEYYQNGLWQDRFESVLWVPLRQLKTHFPKRLEDLLCNQYFVGYESSEAQALSKVFHAHQDKTLFILDGLDEVVGELDEHSPLRALVQNLLAQTYVVITSRPAGVEVSLLGQLDLELETVGFSPDNIQAYIGKCVPESNQAAIRQFIKRTPLIQGLVSIPIQLDALCYSWNDGFAQNQDTVTMAMLYEAMVDKLWRKDCLRLGKEENGKLLNERVITNLSEEELAELILKETTYLGYLALKGIENRKIEFSVKELNQTRVEFNKNRFAQTKLSYSFTTDLQKTSFLHTVDAQQPEIKRHYHFLHLTFQEFFAAKFLVQCLQTDIKANREAVSSKISHRGLSANPSQDELQAFIVEHKYDPHYEIVWWLVAGLLEGAALERFFSLLEEAPRDLIGMRHQQVIMSCLNEARAHLNQWDATIVAKLEEELMEWLGFEIRLAQEASILGRQAMFPEHLLLKCLNESRIPKDKIIETLEERLILSETAIRALFFILQCDENSDVKDAAARVLGKQAMLSKVSIGALTWALERSEDLDVEDVVARALERQAMLSKVAIKVLPSVSQGSADTDARDQATRALERDAILPVPLFGALPKPTPPYMPTPPKFTPSYIPTPTPLGFAPQPMPFPSIPTPSASQPSRDTEVKNAVARTDGQTLPIPAPTPLFSSSLSAPKPSPAPSASQPSRDTEVKNTVSRTEVQTVLSGESVKALLDTLRYEHYSNKSDAFRVLDEQKELSANVVQILVGVLQDKDKYIRGVAAGMLAKQNTLPEYALQALSNVFHDENGAVRDAVTRALKKQNALPEAVLYTLVQALQHENWSSKYSAASILEKQSILPEFALQALVNTLQEKDQYIKDAAAGALEKQRTLPEPVIKALIHTLQHKDWSVRSESARALGSQQKLSEAAFKALINAIEHKNWAVRSEVARALEKQQTLPEAATLALIMTLQDKNGSVRDAAARALSMHMDEVYKILPILNANQIQILYTKFLFGYSRSRNASLHVRDGRFHFYTEKGADQTDRIEGKKIKEIIQVFEAVQIKEMIK